MGEVSVRYIVDDVEAAIAFYTGSLGFAVKAHPAPPFAILERDDLRLLLNDPSGGGGAAQTATDGRNPEPGGWNRLMLHVDDLESVVADLRGGGAHFRTELAKGVGGSQILVEDPAGNPIELFEAART
jgi:catechol 2,3-dioxygenase-like lactoylglutathione lyase family enzyme